MGLFFYTTCEASKIYQKPKRDIFQRNIDPVKRTVDAFMGVKSHKRIA